MSDETIRVVNASIGSNYDALIYDPTENPLTDVQNVCGVASLFGEGKPPRDVLDLGCGTGVQLARAARQVSGRIVGTDISAGACARAAERLRALGRRARVLNADLLEIEGRDLGEFDVIYSVGVVYVVPQRVRQKIIQTIGECLRPGGAAVVSYYAGSLTAVRADLHRQLRLACRGLSNDAAIVHARGYLQQLERRLEGVRDAEFLRSAIAISAEQPDVIFFHEALNYEFEPIQTSWLEGEMAGYGLVFAGYLPANGLGTGPTSQQRARTADIIDFPGGPYRHAVFVRSAPRESGFDSGTEWWKSRLVRPNAGQLEGEQACSVPGSRQSLRVGQAASSVMLDCLMKRPASSQELIAKVPVALSACGHTLGQHELQIMENDLLERRRRGLAQPLTGASAPPS